MIRDTSRSSVLTVSTFTISPGYLDDQSSGSHVA
jgi:hypothetical protein